MDEEDRLVLLAPSSSLGENASKVLRDPTDSSKGSGLGLGLALKLLQELRDEEAEPPDLPTGVYF